MSSSLSELIHLEHVQYVQKHVLHDLLLCMDHSNSCLMCNTFQSHTYHVYAHRSRLICSAARINPTQKQTMSRKPCYCHPNADCRCSLLSKVWMQPLTADTAIIYGQLLVDTIEGRNEFIPLRKKMDARESDYYHLGRIVVQGFNNKSNNRIIILPCKPCALDLLDEWKQNEFSGGDIAKRMNVAKRIKKLMCEKTTKCLSNHSRVVHGIIRSLPLNEGDSDSVDDHHPHHHHHHIDQVNFSFLHDATKAIFKQKKISKKLSPIMTSSPLGSERNTRPPSSDMAPQEHPSEEEDLTMFYSSTFPYQRDVGSMKDLHPFHSYTSYYRNQKNPVDKIDCFNIDYLLNH